MTGLTVTSVNVHVQGVNIPEEKKNQKWRRRGEIKMKGLDKFNLILFQ